MTTSVTEVKTELLRLEHISKHYAGVTALKDVDLSLLAGEVHALLGENGAGKSTLMGIASGSTPADPGGTILVDGEPKSPYTPGIATSSGVAIVHQHPAVLPDLTVAENLLIAIPRTARGRSGNWSTRPSAASGSCRLLYESSLPCRTLENATVGSCGAANSR